MTEAADRQDIDRWLVRQIGRWAIVVTALLALYVGAMLASWPFPDVIDVLQGPFYVIVGVALILATAAITFLGYRIVTMRVVQRARSVFLIFLPAVFLLSSVIGFLLLTAPR